MLQIKDLKWTYLFASNQEPLSFIVNLSDNYIKDIGECERAKDAWKTLEEIHSNFGILHVLMLLRQVANFVKTDGTSMQDCMSKIQVYNCKITKGTYVIWR